jgi:hypothetical protein
MFREISGEMGSMQAQTQDKIQDGRTDFDFFMGKWKSLQRRLKERLKGCTEWEEFEGVSIVQHVLGGLGNMDELTLYRNGEERRGTTLRLFDVETRLWYIYWADGVHGKLDVPMVGAFVDGVGDFYCHEVFQGMPVFTRYRWMSQSENACRWEQAFSPDGGKSWETNWTADFSRIE